MQPNIAIDDQPTNPLEVPGYLKATAEAAMDLATDCETTNNLTQSLFTGRDGVYWRFNAGVKDGDDWKPNIPMDDYKDMQKLVNITITYLGTEVQSVGQCALTLAAIPPA